MSPPASRNEPSASPLREVARNLVLATIALVLFWAIAFALGELAVRVQRGTLGEFENTRARQEDMLRSAYPTAYDPQLGYVPRPGPAPENPWGTRVTIEARGLRSNGPEPHPPGLPVLAVGDSYVFGDEVGDAQTWPAHLERLLERRVLNGGVFGYGCDQIALRAERLVPRHDPALLVVALIGDDLARAQYAYRFAWKPWFEVEGGELALRGVPVPRDPPPPLGLHRLKGVLGYSELADLLLRRVAPGWWLAYPGLRRVHERGPEVCRRLVTRLAELAQARQTPLVLVAQGLSFPRWNRALGELLAYARGLPGVHALDLRGPLFRILRADPERARKLVLPQNHMSDEGNAWVARHVAELIRREGLLDPAG